MRRLLIIGCGDIAQRAVPLLRSRYRIIYALARSQARIAALRALGLGKIGSSNTLPDRPEIRGMIARVPHLVKVEDAG